MRVLNSILHVLYLIGLAVIIGQLHQQLKRMPRSPMVECSVDSFGLPVITTKDTDEINL